MCASSSAHPVCTLRALRDFFDSHGFMEVETPVLQPIYGGAAGRLIPPQPAQTGSISADFVERTINAC
jgi:elongation factor P--beta-lysine ligase